MADLEELAQGIRNTIPGLKYGSILLWGEPLGRPGEDGRRLTGCEAVNNCLRLKFENDEVLAVWNPLDVKITTKRFRIGSADCTRFTHYYADRPRTPENTLYRDYSLQDGLVVFRTNENRVPGSGWMHEGTAISFAAVEITFDPFASDSRCQNSSPKIQ